MVITTSSSILLLHNNPHTMCRSTDLLLHPSPYPHDDGVTLNIKALFVHVRTSPPASDFNNPSLPQSLTILFDPPNHYSLSLHRIFSHPLPYAIFAAKVSLCLRRRRRHSPSQPFSFQLVLGEAVLLKGALIEQDQHRLTLECKSQLHLLHRSLSHPISEVQLCFAFEDGNLAATNWMRIVNPKERMKHCFNVGHLEQIPEEMELPSEDSHEVLDLERLRRTVDLGIWVLFLEVAYWVSRASVRKFRPYLNP